MDIQPLFKTPKEYIKISKQIIGNNLVLFFFVLLLFLICFIVWVYRLQNKHEKKINCSRCLVVFRNTPVPVAGRRTISYSEFQAPMNQAFTISLSLYISDWQQNINYWKHVFHRGNALNQQCSSNISWDQIGGQCPGIWLGDVKNDIRVVIQTSNTSITSSQYSEEWSNTLCNTSSGSLTSSTTPSVVYSLEYTTIENIPIGKWFHVTIMIHDKQLEVYVDGSLKKTKWLHGKPNIINTNAYFGLGQSFAGYISNFYYIPDVLNVRDIQYLYYLQKRIDNKKTFYLEQ